MCRRSKEEKRITSILQHLRSLDSYDSLLALFDALGFTYSGEPRSTADWPSAIRDAVSEFRLAGRHGTFGILYLEIPEQRMLGWERQIVSRALNTEPHSLFVFTNSQHRLWHFVHVRYDERTEQRRQLRRFVVDLREPGAAKRLRTTAERLSRLAIAPGERLSALELQKRCDDAFRVSEVTKDFLRSFVHIVDDLTKSLRKNNPSLLATDADALRQAQLLTDRLVFLYFVQKKGWLNDERDYLYKRFCACYQSKATEDTYYRERLLPLFRSLSHQSALRPRSENGTEEALPFLNGGLFDLPLSYGTANPTTDERVRVPNESLYPVFEDFLERYNFTTTEDTPLDVEVAINPEVIGTIFETFVLTSEKEPETNASDRRKATGSYYTPRCVVHFICRAAFRRYLAERTSADEEVLRQLIEYVPAEQMTGQQEVHLRELLSPAQAEEIRSAVLQMRACDPAVGSGAFPVGLLQEMVKLVTLLDLRIHGRSAIEGRNYAYDLKKRIIEECLYGVDIQEQAIQICELRLWLSLVVDYQTEESLPLHERIAQIEPLPNLTFRVRVGDSLLDQVFGRDWDVQTSRHHDLIGQITEAKRLYYASRSPEGKRDLEMQILSLQLQLLERLLEEERLVTGHDLPLLQDSISSKLRKKLEAVKERLEEIDQLLQRCRDARKLAAQPVQDTWEHARRFDAIRKNIGVSFVWALDFAEVFDPARRNGETRPPGFDVILGNPPFVTARKPDERERYRLRWPTSCYKKYHMLAPFIELALLKLLRPQGQLGYIVSNAFATRDFGKPLVEEVLTRVELLNVVDCSGLMFPGHGTPTCILLGRAIPGHSSKATAGRHFLPGAPRTATKLCGTKPGMGQLREEAEETELWAETEAGWETPTFSGQRVEVTEWPVSVTRSHPWCLNASGTDLKEWIEKGSSVTLVEFSGFSISYSTVSGMDPIFVLTEDCCRRMHLSDVSMLFVRGEDVRDWSIIPSGAAVFPYSSDGRVLAEAQLSSKALEYLVHMRPCLIDRQGMLFQTGLAAGDPWYRYEYYDHSRGACRSRVVWAFIGTHVSASHAPSDIQTNRTVNNFIPREGPAEQVWPLALLNSSASLFWLRQVCFCRRESSNPEADNYYEFSGGKVEQLPVPKVLTANSAVKARAGGLGGRCSQLGSLVPGLHPRKLFETPGEAYTDWYRGIRGYQEPHSGLYLAWETANDLRTAWQLAVEEMRRLRCQMVALQEEMDWLMYGAYGLLPLDHPAVNLTGSEEPLPFDRSLRPYRLAQNGQSIPETWPENQKALWEARLQAISENEHVAQVEQPAYKRRWEEPFGDKDFLAAYEWWLRDKAEWLLEHRYDGGPVNLEMWAKELSSDARVAAAYRVAMEIGGSLPDAIYKRELRCDFATHLRRVIEAETVPDHRGTFKSKHEKLRGIHPDKHLPNGVPRERFRSVTDKPGWYVWAGKDLWGGVEGDVWDA
ncbi:MAG: hypothetical protein HYX92_07730 [Chloroflexi bacterium]|nr:hypothetical protein [Chloroflexota bacterium]